MAFLRQKMASFLTDAALRGMKALDANSSCAKALKKIDVENVLNEDINRICEAMSLAEIAKILSLAVKLKTSSQETSGAIKSDIKKIAEEVVTRLERKSGRLKIPEPCRHILLNL